MLYNDFDFKTEQDCKSIDIFCNFVISLSRSYVVCVIHLRDQLSKSKWQPTTSPIALSKLRSLSWVKVSNLIDQTLPQSKFFQTGQFIYFGFVKILFAVPGLCILM